MTLTSQTSRIIDYLRVADVIVQDMYAQLPLERQPFAGGVFCLADNAGQLIASFVVGSVPDEKRAKYWELAHEKVARMIASGAVSSRATRDPAQGRWAGALRGKESKLCASFSGLPENFDEIVVARALVDGEDLTPEEGRVLLSENADFKALFASGKIPWD